jgi:hypothetical protein
MWSRSEDIIQGFYASLLQMNDPIHKLVLINICGAVVVTDDDFDWLGVLEIMPCDQTFHIFKEELYI